MLIYFFVTVDSLFKVPQIKNLLAKCKRIFNFLKYRKNELSENFLKIWQESLELIDNELLIDEQIEQYEQEDDDDDIDEFTQNESLINICQPSTLKNSVPTRWNSNLHMIRSFIQNYDIICLTLMQNQQQIIKKKKEFNEYMLDGNDHLLLQDLEQFLTIFEDVTKNFCKSNAPTINIVIPLKLAIERQLKNNTYKTSALTDLQNLIIDNLNKRVQVSTEAKLACILDPELKNNTLFESMLDYESPMDLILDNIYNYIKKPDEDAIMINVENDEEEEDNDDDRQMLRNKLADLGGKCITSNLASQSDDLEKEIRQYLKDTTQRKSLLKFWKKKVIEYPNLSKLARSIYCIPATSAPSERIFSLSGLLITATRSSLKDTSIKYSLFLQVNKKFVQIFVNEFSSKELQAALNCEIDE